MYGLRSVHMISPDGCVSVVIDKRGLVVQFGHKLGTRKSRCLPTLIVVIVRMHETWMSRANEKKKKEKKNASNSIRTPLSRDYTRVTIISCQYR